MGELSGDGMFPIMLGKRGRERVCVCVCVFVGVCVCVAMCLGAVCPVCVCVSEQCQFPRRMNEGPTTNVELV